MFSFAIVMWEVLTWGKRRVANKSNWCSEGAHLVRLEA